MLEEIKLLLPLMEGVANGTIWVLISYFGISFLKFLLGMLVIMYVIRAVVGFLLSMTTSDKLAATLGIHEYDGCYPSHRERLNNRVNALVANEKNHS